MHKAWLSLGANIGDPEFQLEQAVARLDAEPNIRVTRRSSIHATKPWGNPDQNDFKNMALEVTTDSTPQELLAACLDIETKLGRIRNEHWGPRLIDIDIIAFDRQEVSEPGLKIPHPFAHDRGFVLAPLREIAQEVADWLVQRKA